MSSSASKPFKLFAGNPGPGAGQHPRLALLRKSTRSAFPPMRIFSALRRNCAYCRRNRHGNSAAPSRAQDAQRVLASAVELREALAAVLYAWIDGGKPAMGRWKYWKRTSMPRPCIAAFVAGDQHLVWSWSGSEQQAEIPLWKLAQSASDLLVSEDAERVKDCGDPTCRWLFLDLSKNHTRRWCDMKTCGNRMKARRHQARLAGNAVIN